MDRVVFCPNSDLMDNASAVAKEWGIPILCGDSEHTKNLAFDRDSVSVIQIPIYNHFVFSLKKAPKLNETYQISYVNEFVSCENVKVAVQKVNYQKIFVVQTKLTAPHELIGALRFSDTGSYFVTAVLDENELCRLDIVVG